MEVLILWDDCFVEVIVVNFGESCGLLLLKEY